MTWSGEREYSEPEIARQMLEHVPIVPIGSLPENTFGRVRGTCVPFREQGVVIAPVSGRSCFLYLAHVEAIYGPNRQQFGERLGIPFVIEDDDHRAILDPTYARLRIRYERVAMRIGSHATKSEQALLRRLGVPLGAPELPPPQFVFQEARIEPGMRIAACGAGVREPDPDADPTGMYRGEPRTRLRITGSPRTAIAISNDAELLF